MKSSVYVNLLARVRGLEVLIIDLIPASKLEAHRAKFDALEDDQRRAASRKIRAGMGPMREAAKLLHFRFAGEPPAKLSYDEAADVTGLSANTLRVYISRSPHRAYAFFHRGHWEVLAKTEAGAAEELRAKFSETGNPDDLRELSPQGKF